jgi:hypothetical protein
LKIISYKYKNVQFIQQRENNFQTPYLSQPKLRQSKLQIISGTCSEEHDSEPERDHPEQRPQQHLSGELIALLTGQELAGNQLIFAGRIN